MRIKPETAQLASWLGAGGPELAQVPSTFEDWTRFALRVRRNGLAGLVLQAAATADIELPRKIEQTVRAAALAVAAGNVHHKSELESLLAVLNRARIPVMLLKGAALNLDIYDRPDLRPTGDIDLLIPPETAAEALRTLELNGCRRGADLLQEDFFPTYFHEMEIFTGSSTPARLDLHVRPFRPMRIARIMPADAMWRDARTIRVGAAEALVPCLEDTVLHLAGHAAFHGCARLLWQYDIKRFVERHASLLDWDTVTHRAAEWGISLPVLTALEYTNDLFGSVCPPETLQTLRSHRTNWRDRLALRQAPRDAASPVSHFLVDMLCTPGIRFRLGYARAVLAPSRTHLAEIYPFRHRGWVAPAHAWRFLRAVGRIATASRRRLGGAPS